MKMTITHSFMYMFSVVMLGAFAMMFIITGFIPLYSFLNNIS